MKPFEGHPYKVIDNEEMDALTESIREHGIMTPLIVRRAGNGYEIISGHRRTKACELAGVDTIPAIIREMDYDSAVIAMVDSNLQREEILPTATASAEEMIKKGQSNHGSDFSEVKGQEVAKRAAKIVFTKPKDQD